MLNVKWKVGEGWPYLYWGWVDVSELRVEGEGCVGITAGRLRGPRHHQHHHHHHQVHHHRPLHQPSLPTAPRRAQRFKLLLLGTHDSHIAALGLGSGAGDADDVLEIVELPVGVGKGRGQHQSRLAVHRQPVAQPGRNQSINTNGLSQAPFFRRDRFETLRIFFYINKDPDRLISSVCNEFCLII